MPYINTPTHRRVEVTETERLILKHVAKLYHKCPCKHCRRFKQESEREKKLIAACELNFQNLLSPQRTAESHTHAETVMADGVGDFEVVVVLNSDEHTDESYEDARRRARRRARRVINQIISNPDPLPLYDETDTETPPAYWTVECTHEEVVPAYNHCSHPECRICFPRDRYLLYLGILRHEEATRAAEKRLDSEFKEQNGAVAYGCRCVSKAVKDWYWEV